MALGNYEIAAPVALSGAVEVVVVGILAVQETEASSSVVVAAVEEETAVVVDEDVVVAPPVAKFVVAVGSSPPFAGSAARGSVASLEVVPEAAVLLCSGAPRDHEVVGAERIDHFVEIVDLRGPNTVGCTGDQASAFRVGASTGLGHLALKTQALTVDGKEEAGRTVERNCRDQMATW